MTAVLSPYPTTEFDSFDIIFAGHDVSAAFGCLGLPSCKYCSVEQVSTNLPPACMHLQTNNKRFWHHDVFVSSFYFHQSFLNNVKCRSRGHVDPKMYFGFHNRIMFTVVGIFCSSDIGWFRNCLFLCLFSVCVIYN